MRTVLVTGADRGIGHALCRACHARGDTVVAACLDDSEELRALDIRVEPGIDVTSDDAVRSLAESLTRTGTTLDVLINNAGIAGPDHVLGALDYDDIRRQIEVNALGPLRVTEALLERLKPGSTVAFITSRIGSLGDNHSGGLYGYRISKCAANMVAVNLAHDLATRGIGAVVLHPGMVATAMTFDDERAEARPPEEAAAALIERIERAGQAEPGAPPAFWHAPERTIIPW